MTFQTKRCNLSGYTLTLNDHKLTDGLSTKGYNVYLGISLKDDLAFTDGLSTKGCNRYGYIPTLNELIHTDGLSTNGCNLSDCYTLTLNDFKLIYGL